MICGHCVTNPRVAPALIVKKSRHECSVRFHASRTRCQPQQLEQQDGSKTWLPPAAWVSAVLGGLQQSVDVDSVGPYTQLLQECVVLQPGLLSVPPNEAAATCCQLERHTRSPAVWFGPTVIANMLQQHSPDSLQQHLSGLLNCWLSQGQSPHSFGALWLQAPAALLQQNVSTFESRLRQLAQLVPEVPPCELLASSPTLSGFLLSLSDLGQLQGHIHTEVPGVVVISHPSLQDVRVEQQGQQQGQGQQQPGLVSVAVYGVVRPGQQQGSRETPAPAAAAAAAGRGSDSSLPQVEPPWQQQPQQRYAGGVYEPCQHSDVAATDSSSSSGGNSTGSGSSSSSRGLQPQLLAVFDVWRPVGPGAPPTPLLVLPPTPQQQQQQG